MNNRYLLVKRGCPYCLDFAKAVRIINMKLSMEKRIQIIDCWLWEEYGVKLEPIMDKFKKDGLAEGFPFCFIDGLIVEPAPTDVLKVYLTKLLEEDIENEKPI